MKKFTFVLVAGAFFIPLVMAGQTMDRFVVATPSLPSYASERSTDLQTNERVIALQISRIPLEQALREVSRRSGVGIVYASDLLPRNRRVSLTAASISPQEAVQRLLQGMRLRATTSNTGQITIVPIEPSQNATRGVIRGRVIHAQTKAPLSGVYITVEGTQLSVRTRDDGTFTIPNVPAGKYSVLARSPGYSRGLKTVEVAGSGTVEVDFQLETAVTALGEVVVTSTVGEVDRRTSSVNITVITAKDIEDRNITNISQLFRGDIPGIYMPDQGPVNRNPRSNSDFTTQETPMVRGQNFLSADVNSPGRLKVYVDGILVNDYQYISQMDPASIDHMEVVSGPAATTIYGSEASDGVIQIFTKRGSLSSPIDFRLNAQAMIFDSRYKDDPVVSPLINAFMTGGTDMLSYSLGATYSSEGAWLPGYKNTAFNTDGGLQFTNGPVRVTLSGSYIGPKSYNNVSSVHWSRCLLDGRCSRAKLASFGLIPSSERTTVTSPLVGGTLSWTPNQSVFHEGTLGLNIMNVTTEQSKPSFVTLYDTLLGRTMTTNSISTARYRTTWIQRFGDFSSFLGGVLDYSSKTFSGHSVGSLPRLQESAYSMSSTFYESTYNVGYAGEWTLDYRGRLILKNTVRLEQSPRYGRDVKFEPQYNIGLSAPMDLPYEITIKPRIAYGQATRAPLAYQRDGQSGGTGTGSGRYLQVTNYLANPGLRPSQQSGYDVGLELFLGNRAYFSFGAYRQHAFDDIWQIAESIDTLPTPPGSAYDSAIVTSYRYLNLAKMKTHGVELIGNTTIGPVTLNSTYTTSSNIIQAVPPGVGITPTYGASLMPGDRLPYVPTYNWATTIKYAYGATSLSITALSSGRREANDQVYAMNRLYGAPEYDGPALPGRPIMLGKWTKYDLDIRRRITNKFETYGNVRNLTSNMLEEGIDLRSPMTGRVVTLGIRVSH